MSDRIELDDVMDSKEAAALLKMPERSLTYQAKNERVPHFRVGKQYRFRRGVLLAWIRDQERRAYEN
jgi:excisionase family DNA binding protein